MPSPTMSSLVGSSAVPSTPASPTGVPIFGQLLWRIAAGLVASASVILPLVPEHTVGAKILIGIIGIGGAIGIASPGIRYGGVK